MKAMRLVKRIFVFALVGTLLACGKKPATSQDGTAQTSTQEATGTVSFSVTAEGFSDTSTPLALLFKSGDNAFEAYVDSEHTNLSLPAGTYTMTYVGSPINMDGSLYAIPSESTEVVVTADKECTVDISLEPLSVDDATQEEVEAAKNAARAAVEYMQKQDDMLVEYLGPRVDENIAALEDALE